MECSSKTKNNKREFVVYVAGPYRGNIKNNIKEACEIGAELRKAGYTVIIPHIESYGYESALTEEEWLAHGIELLKRCNAVYDFRKGRLSTGTADEVAVAKKRNTPVCYSVEGVHEAYYIWDNALNAQLIPGGIPEGEQ